MKLGGGNVDESGYQRGGGPLQYLPPNMGGQRVVKKQVSKRDRSSAGGDATSEIARRGFLGLAGLSTVAYFSATGRQTKKASPDETDPFGNAVTAPTLELHGRQEDKPADFLEDTKGSYQVEACLSLHKQQLNNGEFETAYVGFRADASNKRDLLICWFY